MGADAVLSVIFTRRSVRTFWPEPVPAEDIDLIVEAGLSAPSSKNSQPWYVVICKDPIKERVCEWVEQNPLRVPTKPGRLMIDEPTARPRDSTFQTLRYVRAAPVLLMLFNRGPFTGGKQRMEEEIRNGRRVSFENEYVGIGTCLENILLTAHALGLGAIAVMDILPAGPLIRDTFNIEYDLVVGVAIGYPRKTPSRRSIEVERFVRYLE